VTGEKVAEPSKPGSAVAQAYSRAIRGLLHLNWPKMAISVSAPSACIQSLITMYMSIIEGPSSLRAQHQANQFWRGARPVSREHVANKKTHEHLTSNKYNVYTPPPAVSSATERLSLPPTGRAVAWCMDLIGPRTGPIIVDLHLYYTYTSTD
jgi:hypothetical protein